ncbi:uncharacterized protein LOC142586180 [Dermacentor variabilis]|uniref:uncharacterized protein LOC142586180 n=1 Tax=Dermacentor variabilis TaxID=34621 RepID=UPI003F5C36DD
MELALDYQYLHILSALKTCEYSTAVAQCLERWTILSRDNQVPYLQHIPLHVSFSLYENSLVEDLGGLLGKYFFVVIAATLATLIMAPNEAGALPPNVWDTIIKTTGRYEDNVE